ncbi:hypothetical protein AB9P05_18080 [Roseivirga sp. BDSF3-8]|uniref:hypothetical protein n=1 Tax=Roseivirga sp. BDSF3-8 TaxID=3241598 RepID=UPI0035325ADB
MEDILKKAGITAFDDAMYTFYPQILPWWDEEDPIEVEVEVGIDEFGTKSVAILFSYEIDEVRERDAIFLCEYKGKELMQNTMVTDAVAEHIGLEDELNFLDEEEAYTTQSFELTRKVLDNILDLIEKPQFVKRTSFCNLPDEMYEYAGDTLNHFLAMYKAAYDEFSPESIREHLETVTAIEGGEYIEELKHDLSSPTLPEVMEEHDINDEVINLIAVEVNTYQSV